MSGGRAEVLHVSLLGEQTISDGGAGVQARSSRAMALVAFLVAHADVPQPRQRIAGMFWPESTDAQALTNLRRELHHLRQVLGDDRSLVVTPRDLCWRDSGTCRVDLRIFETERQAALESAGAGDDEGVLRQAAAAVAQYRGDLLPGVYDDWLLEARSQLERQCADLCDLLCAARARTGDLAGAVDAVRRRIQLQPLEEVGYRTLMLLQADLGDRAGAISTYHHCASVLERELGVIPDPATRQAYRRLMAVGDPASARLPGLQLDAPRSGLAAAQLVGRLRELGLLQDLWRAAAAGRPGLALVGGGAGVGKTRLVAEVAAVARRQGAVVAGSQCFGTSGRLALAPVADWLRNPAVQAAAVTLDPAWRAEVRRLVPTGGRGERAAASMSVADAWQRHRFFEGLARALMAVGRPLLLVLDNMQWCDQETLAFLTFFFGLAPGTPVLVAGTLRNDTASGDPELADWIARMRATGLMTELSLGPLEAADTARLAAAISGRPLLADEVNLLQATTGGFPLYVTEAVRGDADPGGAPRPAGDLTAVLRGRLEQASAAAREVAGLAAAVGTNFTLDLLTEASDLDIGSVVAAVDELWRRRIVREFRDGYDFSHDLLRDTAYAQVSPPQRWLLHRRVAQALELLHADDTDTVSAQLAEQYARGGRPGRAVAYYRRAADVAAGMFAHAEAIRLHREALSIARSLPEGRDRDRQELEVLEAMAAPLNARYGYSSPELERALERSIDLAESLRRSDSTLTGLVALWGTQFVQGRIADGYETASRALTLVDPDSQLSGPAHFAVGGSAVSLGMPAEGLRHLELAAKLASGAVWLSVGTRADVHGTAFAAHAHWLLGHDAEALSACHGAIKLARAIDHPYCLAVALAYGSITLQMRHDRSELREMVGELRELCGRYGFAYYREWGLILDGWSRPGESGIDLARQGIANLKTAGSFARMPYWLSLLADLLARSDRLDAAQAILDAALIAGRERDDLWWLPEVMRLRAAYDEQEAAIPRLRSAAEMASAHGSVGLLRRCEHDLSTRGVRIAPPSVLPAG
ncbi:MAG: family transcriptional regulator [Actinomycetia bacterium]|nr:family transcriptional regulator [Actinomycetes bacterium]